MLSKSPDAVGILAHAQAVDTRPTSLSEVRTGIEANILHALHYITPLVSLKTCHQLRVCSISSLFVCNFQVTDQELNNS